MKRLILCLFLTWTAITGIVLSQPQNIFVITLGGTVRIPGELAVGSDDFSYWAPGR